MEERQARLESLKSTIERYGLNKFISLSGVDKNAFLKDLNCDKDDFDEVFGEELKKEIRLKFLSLIHLKNYPEASELLTEYILKQRRIFTTKDDTKSEMWVYKEGIYVPHGRSEVKELLRSLLLENFSTYHYNMVIAKIEADTFIDPDEFFLNDYPEEIPVQNGILHIFTLELSEFTPNKIFFNKLPITYDDEKECPEIDKFLSEVFKDGDDKKVFYELGGYCLHKKYNFENAFMFVGDGRNGKDKCLELIKKAVGVNNYVSIPLNSLQPDSFSIGELFMKMINIAGDISGSDLKDTSMLKALTGRSSVSAKRKFLRDIHFTNYAKMIFACNQLPMVYDLSRGFWDRWVLFEFPYTFVDQQELDANKDKKNLKLRDENIIDKITTEDEMSGLLNKFLEGLRRLNVNKGFSTSQGTEEVKNVWIRKANSFIAFCMDRIEEDPEGQISKKELRAEYSKFCKEHKVMGKSDIVIKRVLQEQYGASDEQKTVKPSQTSTLDNSYEWDRFWVGVKWKEEKIN